MKKIIFFTVLLLTIIACKSSKKMVTTAASLEPTSQTPQVVKSIALMDTMCRFTVSFISIGAGIDHQAKGELDQYILKVNKKYTVKIISEIAKWGREGEVDYCFKLNELNTQQQDLFISETKELLKNSTRVRYVENSICRHKSK
jgi:hypothetical protein